MNENKEKDFVTSDNKSSSSIGDAPVNTCNSVEQFAEAFSLSPVFVDRLKELFLKLKTGLTAHEWSEYREKARMFTDQVVSKLKS